ncbi:MAG: TIGR01777 family oxidoreductase [Planctomycetota bacterium]|jgi:uncharacterized protein (TIGR01777 family)
MPVFEKSSELPVSAETAFDWHCRPGAFERLAPPWESVELLSTDGIVDGGIARLQLSLGPLKKLWIAEHRDIVPGRAFCDVQTSGPFAEWGHTHSLEPLDQNRCLLTDRIEYRAPLGVLGQLFGGRLIRRSLERTFAYRHRITERDLRFHTAAERTSAMRIAVGGSTGMVGSELVSFLTTGGHDVLRLTRGSAIVDDDAHKIAWDPAAGTIDADALEGCDAVVHLGGHNIAHGRWTDRMKRMIHDSRVDSTTLLARTLAGLKNPPKVFVCASAIGYYGDRGGELMTEDSLPGPSFLSRTCVEWEQATQAASDSGIRVVNLRIGVVLSPKGGALKKMLTPFQLGGGGVVGNGRQWMSWVALDELPRITQHCIENESLTGPVNAVAPESVDNRAFTRTLGRVLRRPTVFPLPAFVVRTIFGEMGEELLLGSTKVEPTRLEASGYEFAYPTLEPALRHVLGR